MIKILKKTRSDASWMKLTKPQRALLEQWLFDDGLSYEEALTRAKAEWGYAASPRALQRFYKRCAQERLLRELTESGSAAEEVCTNPARTEALVEASRKVLAQGFFERLRTEGIADVAAMGKLWAQSEAEATRRGRLEVQRAAQATRQERLKLDTQRWQWDVTFETAMILPEMIQFEQQRTEAADPYWENKRSNRIRMNLFGPNIPDRLPESVEEEKVMGSKWREWESMGATARVTARKGV